jgi:spore coat protein CotH
VTPAQRGGAGLFCVVGFVVAGLGTPVPATAQTAEQLFDASQLQEVRLFVNARDLEELRSRYLENIYYPADVQWGGTTVRNAAVRSRGGGSRSPSKPGLLLDFDRFVTGQTFLGRRAIVIDNLWQDPSMVRERVAMALFARMGLAAPLESFCRLYINNEYAGVYALVENIDKAFLQRTGGVDTAYLHEYHWLTPYYLADLGDDLNAYSPLFEPRTHESESAAALFDPIRELVRAINEPSDTLWRAGIERQVDLGQLLAFAAVESFVAELDGLLGYAGVNNFYLHRAAGSTVHQLIPWDRDNAFQAVEASIFARVEENPLVRRALTHPDLYAAFLDALERTARAAANGWLENEVRAAVSVTQAAAAEDPLAPYATADREAAIAHLLDFARRRPQIVLDQVAAARAR